MKYRIVLEIESNYLPIGDLPAAIERAIRVAAKIDVLGRVFGNPITVRTLQIHGEDDAPEAPPE